MSDTLRRSDGFTPIAFVDPDGRSYGINKDAVTGSQIVVSYAHHELHEGGAFTAHLDMTTDSDDDHRTAIGFSTPDTAKWAHLIIAVSSSDPAEFFIEEDVTIDNDAGTEMTVYNRNRNSDKTSTLLSLEGTPVASLLTTFNEAQLAVANYSVGTIIWHNQLVGGTGTPFPTGGTSRGVQEWILKQGTKYLLVLQNIGASENFHEIHMGWYEHTNKE